MAYVLFIQNPDGYKSIPQHMNGRQSETDYLTVNRIAASKNIPCIRVDFQISHNSHIFPEFGQMIAARIADAQNLHGDPGLIVASSLGAGMAVRALSKLPPDLSLPHVIAHQPVLDPALRPTGKNSRLIDKFEENLGGKKLPSLVILASGETLALPENAHEFAATIKNYVENGGILISLEPSGTNRTVQLREAIEDRLEVMLH